MKAATITQEALSGKQPLFNRLLWEHGCIHNGVLDCVAG